MPGVHTHVCSNHDCRRFTDVYFEEGPLLMGDRYFYICPKCGKKESFKAPPVSQVEKIPADGVIAEQE